jgi:hypothetical protein
MRRLTAEETGLAALRELSESLRAFGDDYSMPICSQMVGGNARLIGSGSLFAVTDKVFLITASHVVEEHFPRKVRSLRNGEPNDCHLLVPSAGDRLVSISGRVTGSPKFDVAVLEISSPQELTTRWTPIELDQVSLGEPTEGWHHFAGWPVQLSSRSAGAMQGDRYRFTCRSENSIVDDEQLELALPIDLNGHVTFDGTPASLPALEGISGCPVWRVFGEHPSEYRPRVAGVETGYIRKAQHLYVKATRWHVVLSLIERAYPGLLGQTRLST